MGEPGRRNGSRSYYRRSEIDANTVAVLYLLFQFRDRGKSCACLVLHRYPIYIYHLLCIDIEYSYI